MTGTPRPDPNSLDLVAGFSYRKVIDEALAEERTTKSSLEQRGLAVVTTSGVVATLLFGLAAFAKQAQKVSLGSPEVEFLIGALVFFLLSASSALWIIRPRPYDEAGIQPLRQRLTPESWSDTNVIEAARRDAQLSVDILERARNLNKCKASWLFKAVICEVIAAVFVAGAASAVVVHALASVPAKSG